MILYTIIYVYFLTTQVEPARILAMFPTPSVSHQIVFRPFTQELAKRGHQVTVITPNPAFPNGRTPENLTEVDVHDVSYGLISQFHKRNHANSQNVAEQAKLIFDFSIELNEAQFKTQKVNETISKEYDLLILEACVKVPLVLSHMHKIPTILISSFGSIGSQYHTMGAPEHPILYPSNTHQKLYNLTKIDKIKEIYKYLLIKYYEYKSEEKTDEAIKKIFGNVPSLKELQNNIDILFFNEHTVWADNRPVPPNVVYLGGLHLTKRQPLSQDLENYLNTSKNGVIYFSFGTNTLTSLLPKKTVEMFIRVFSQLPYDVLMKWDSDELPGKTNNIKIGKWFPQKDLLAHPKIKLFITQGGLQSTDEAISAGVPMIGIPMLADQWYNTEKYVKFGIGIKLDIATLEEDIFRNAIKEVISNESYRKNIVRLRAQMYDQPQTSLERAVWWTEYVLRNGGAKHLRPATANMSWTEYLELELIGFILIIFMCLLTMIVLMVRYIYHCIRFPMNVKMKKT